MDFELLAARLIRALLEDDPAESELQVMAIQARAGLTDVQMAPAMATAREAASWWRFRPEYVENGRELLDVRVMELTGTLPGN